MEKETQKQEMKTATAYGRSLPISRKQSVEVCSAIRGKRIADVKRILNDVIVMRTPVKFRRYNDNVGHRRGHMGPGRFPVKACTEILMIVESAEANANAKGMNTQDLVLSMITACKAGTQLHSGRRRRKMKRTHIRVALEEKPQEKKEKKK